MNPDDNTIPHPEVSQPRSVGIHNTIRVYLSTHPEIVIPGIGPNALENMLMGQLAGFFVAKENEYFASNFTNNRDRRLNQDAAISYVLKFFTSRPATTTVTVEPQTAHRVPADSRATTLGAEAEAAIEDERYAPENHLLYRDKIGEKWQIATIIDDGIQDNRYVTLSLPGVENLKIPRGLEATPDGPGMSFLWKDDLPNGEPQPLIEFLGQYYSRAVTRGLERLIPLVAGGTPLNTNDVANLVVSFLMWRQNHADVQIPADTEVPGHNQRLVKEFMYALQSLDPSEVAKAAGKGALLGLHVPGPIQAKLGGVVGGALIKGIGEIIQQIRANKAPDEAGDTGAAAVENPDGFSAEEAQRIQERQEILNRIFGHIGEITMHDVVGTKPFTLVARPRLDGSFNATPDYHSGVTADTLVSDLETQFNLPHDTPQRDRLIVIGEEREGRLTVRVGVRDTGTFYEHGTYTFDDEPAFNEFLDLLQDNDDYGLTEALVTGRISNTQFGPSLSPESQLFTDLTDVMESNSFPDRYIRRPGREDAIIIHNSEDPGTTSPDADASPTPEAYPMDRFMTYFNENPDTLAARWQEIPSEEQGVARAALGLRVTVDQIILSDTSLFSEIRHQLPNDITFLEQVLASLPDDFPAKTKEQLEKYIIRLRSRVPVEETDRPALPVRQRAPTATATEIITDDHDAAAALSGL